MAKHRQTVRTGQTRRPRPDNGNPFAGWCCAFKRMHALFHHHIGGIALKAANLDRLAFGHFAHANLFAQGFGRAHTGAHATQNVFLKNLHRSRFGNAGADLANEHRNVDAGRTGRLARRVITEITTIRRNRCLVRIQWRVQIGKVLGVGVFGQTSRHDPRRHLAVRHNLHPA